MNPEKMPPAQSPLERGDELRKKFLDNTITDPEIWEMVSPFPHGDEMAEAIFEARRRENYIYQVTEAEIRNENLRLLKKILGIDGVTPLGVAREEAEAEDKERTRAKRKKQ